MSAKSRRNRGTIPEPSRNQNQSRHPIVRAAVPRNYRGTRGPGRSLPDSVPRITTNIVGFSRDEWEQIRLAAAALQARGAAAGTLIMPDRPELYRLDRTGWRTFALRLTDVEELAETVRQDARRRCAV